MSKKEEKPKIQFSEIINALLDNNKLFPPGYLKYFSDISDKDLKSLKAIWLQIDPQRRIALMEDFSEMLEVDMRLSYDSLASFALEDPETGVRAAALSILWESENPFLISTFIRMMEKDSDEIVRANAASALGKYVYMGEVEEIPEDTYEMIENKLIAIVEGQDTKLVRRRALEAVAFSCNEKIEALIQTAYDCGDIEWLCSALFAMGRSADPQWQKIVLENFDNPEPEVQFEAVRAAGLLEMKLASERLETMLTKNIDELDEDVRAAAMLSLAQIGSPSARKILEVLLESSEDDDEIEFIEHAMEYLEFTEFAQLLGNISSLDLNADDLEDGELPDDMLSFLFNHDGFGNNGDDDEDEDEDDEIYYGEDEDDEDETPAQA